MVVAAAGAEEWALFLHLLGAFLLVAGAAVAAVAFEAARRRAEPREVALLLGLTRVGVGLVGLGGLLVLAFGLWLVDLEEIGYDAGWVDAAIGLYAAMAVAGALGGQRPKRARKLASALAERGESATAELRALLDDRLALAANYLSGALVAAIVVLMVFKPGGPS
ncbi:MAG TPA: DUF2269 family protein [Gaiellaceae bacterium]|nr:DUF2269 family protein [Gaiellaceae bacterium]